MVKNSRTAPSAASGTPSAAQRALLRLGLQHPVDLALHMPLRFEDATRVTPLAGARAGEVVQIEATVQEASVQYHPRRQLVALVCDGDVFCQLRFFSFYPSLQKLLAPGSRVRLRGELRAGFGGLVMMHPACQPASAPLPGALTPIYPATAGLPQAYLRKAIHNTLQQADLTECLPPDVSPPQGFAAQDWWPLQRALNYLHNPPPDAPLAALEDRTHPAWLRLKAEELLAQQVSQWHARNQRARQRAPQLPRNAGDKASDSLASRLLAGLPFGLTAAQRRVSAEIAADMDSTTPMHRLLQGDVGSGKTVVAALAAAQCIQAGWQCVLMAPTEILAAQHFRKLADWFEPLLQARGRRVAWLAGSQKKKAREAMLADIASGDAALVVGTHAIIGQGVEFARLALAVVDEQHRFGVAQRLGLRHKAATAQTAAAGALHPHMLMMSATPIPRTLAMSYYADLDISTLDELPPGRTPVLTRVLHERRRGEVVARIAAQLALGQQVYWVCPLIEESEALDLRNATATWQELCEALPGVRVGLLHSRLSAAEKTAVMDDFIHGRMGVLVSTTVIEVGVDVPNASLMVIEHAERFGLSQLHQLRGRVGRGSAASYCILLYANNDDARLSAAARARLQAMRETGDGFEIARRDLDIRGPGEFMGARQSGAAMLRFANVHEDAELLHWARGAAPLLLKRHPDLAQRLIRRWMGERVSYLMA